MNKVLVVDQDKAIRLLYTDELAEEGYEVITGEADSELMELIAKRGPDVVVLDIQPGDLEGLGICRDIRKSYDDLPVILSTLCSIGRPDVDSATAHPCGSMSWGLGELKMAVQKAFENRGRSAPGTLCEDMEGHGASLQERDAI